MLSSIRVRDFAIIDELTVDLGPGLNIVTGETGAGKSILVDALSLVMGGKARPEIVRTGAEAAEVEALFELHDAARFQARLEACGLPANDELIIRRIVSENGRSRAYVNGRLVTAQQLGELALGLADISSQHEHHELADPRTHLAHLDSFARVDVLRDDVSRSYSVLKKAHEALRSTETNERERAEREDLLRFQIREIDELALQPGDDERAREECERLRHAEKIIRVTGSAEDALYASDGAVVDALGRIAMSLAELVKIDPSLAAIVSEIDSARAQVEEAARELGRYSRSITGDGEKLAELEERLDRIGRMKRKYGGSIDEIIAHRLRAGEELEKLVNWESQQVELRQTYESALNEARKAATALSKKRRAHAEKLSEAIGAELSSLGMGGAMVQVALAMLEGKDGELCVDGAKLTPAGVDAAEFLIAANKGEDPRPLRRIASGGELSRAMLAIKRVLAGLSPAGLYVFDEVDSGVGGAVAETIGRKLKEVADHHQVLCITHLPQIAVFADKHYRVAKHVVGGRTKSVIEALAATEQREEIARMLGGLKITPKTRAVAAEMLREARA